MPPKIEYETPENVRLSYKPAGLGTRFTAWFLDSIILFLAMFFLFIALMFLGAALESIIRPWARDFDDFVKTDGRENPELILAVMMGIWLLAWGFCGFVYFGLSELFLRGQTIGKKAAKIRVVRLEGFSLDTVSVFVRNIFRVVDHIPLLWIVPLLSAKSQRFGDMVAGTIVVSDEPQELSRVRATLSAHQATDARYRFDNAKLGRLKPTDFEAVEQVLDRWETIPVMERAELIEKIVKAFCRKMQIEESPPLLDYRVFLEDLLAAEFRRQDRQLR